MVLPMMLVLSVLGGQTSGSLTSERNPQQATSLRNPLRVNKPEAQGRQLVSNREQPWQGQILHKSSCRQQNKDQQQAAGENLLLAFTTCKVQVGFHAKQEHRMRTNKFTKGSGCFTCSDCGKQTRNTGENSKLQLCPVCHARGEWRNALADNGIPTEHLDKLHTVKEIAAYGQKTIEMWFVVGG